MDGGENGPRGELLMNGLLVEGALQVLPGSLGKVSLQHCTLTPRAGGLQVYNGASQDRCSATGEFSLVDLVAHSLVLLWQLIGQEIGLKTKAPSMTMIQFLRFICAAANQRADIPLPAPTQA